MKIETRRQRRIIAFNQLHFKQAQRFLSYRKSAGSPLPNARVAYKMAAMRLHSRRINTL